MKNGRLIVALLVAVSSVLMTDVSFAVPPRIGNSSTQSTGTGGNSFAGLNAKIAAEGNPVSVKTGTTIGQVVDSKGTIEGNRIGRNIADRTIFSDDQGRVKYTQDANGTVRLPDGTVRSVCDQNMMQTTSGLKTGEAQNQSPCVPKPNGKYPFECRVESFWDASFDTLEDVEAFVANAWKGKYDECGVATESSALLVEKDGKYFKAGESWFQNKEAMIMGSRMGINSTPGIRPEYIDKLKNEGYRVVETMHNHHKGNGVYSGLYEWPTLSDVVGAIQRNIPEVVFNCMDNLYRIDNETGAVSKRNLQSSDWTDITFEDWGRDDPDWKKTVNAGSQADHLFDKYGKFDENESFEEMKNKLGVLYEGKNPTFTQLQDWVMMLKLKELIDLKKQMNEYLRKIVASGRDASKEERKIYNDLTIKFGGEWERIWSEWYHMENKDERKRLGALIDEKMKPYNDEWSDLKTRYEKDRICFNHDGSLAEMVFPNPKLRIPPKPGEVARSLKKPCWQCTNCGKVFKTGEEYTIHGLGDCSPASKKAETTERRK